MLMLINNDTVKWFAVIYSNLLFTVGLTLKKSSNGAPQFPKALEKILVKKRLNALPSP